MSVGHRLIILQERRSPLDKPDLRVNRIIQVAPVIQINLVYVPLAAVTLPAGLSAGCQADIIIELQLEFLFKKRRIRNGDHDPPEIDIIRHVEGVKLHALD